MSSSATPVSGIIKFPAAAFHSIKTQPRTERCVNSELPVMSPSISSALQGSWDQRGLLQLYSTPRTVRGLYHQSPDCKARGLSSQWTPPTPPPRSFNPSSPSPATLSGAAHHDLALSSSPQAGDDRRFCTCSDARLILRLLERQSDWWQETTGHMVRAKVL